MPPQRVQYRHLKNARNAKKTFSRNPLQDTQNIVQRPIDTILTTINRLNNSELNELLNQIYILKDTEVEITRIQRKKDELIRQIYTLSDEEVLNVHHLLKTMVYPKGIHVGQILSPYLQKKAYTESSAIAIQNKKKSLEKKNKQLKKAATKTNTQIHSLTLKVAKAKCSKTKQTSKIRAAIQNAKKVTPTNFQKTVKRIFKTNKKEYTPQFVKLVTEISNKGNNSVNSTVESTKAVFEFLTGEMPTKWISPSTLTKWNKEVAQINLQEN
ncbi:unnamed protein product [Rhizophagus irregularis]|nr:unnamed protein product [Rhizophagus irregularis]